MGAPNPDVAGLMAQLALQHWLPSNTPSLTAAIAATTVFMGTAGGEINPAVVNFATAQLNALFAAQEATEASHGASTGGLTTFTANRFVSPSGFFGSGNSGTACAVQNTNNGSVFLNGDRPAADTDADVVLTGQVQRTAGLIARFANFGVNVATVNFSGGVQPGQLNEGGVAASAFLYSGSGAPNNTFGNNGDYYFRTDTPGTANQRIYVKSAGTWTGIV